MKNFIRLFLVCFIFFISLCVNACENNQHSILNETNYKILSSNDILIEIVNDTKSAFIENNTNRYELSQLQNKKNPIYKISFNNATNSNKIFQQLYIVSLKPILFCTIDKTSLNLENEICTRAP
jgi:uncharacterized protein YcfL